MAIPLGDWNGSKNIVDEIQKIDKKTTILQWMVIIISLATFVISIFGFNWSDTRSSQVRRNCFNGALEHAVLDTNKPEYYNDDLIKRTQLQNQLIEASYQNCLHENGLSI